MYWLDKFIIFSAVIILNVLFCLVGKLLLRVIRYNRTSSLELWITSFGMGAAFAGTLIFLIGSTLRLSNISWLLFFSIIIGFSILEIILSRKHLNFSAISLFAYNWIEKLLFLILSLVVLYNLYRGLWPDVDFDSTWYHLTEPKLYLMWEKIKFIKGGLLYYSAMPQLVEMLYMVAMLLKGGIAAKLIHTFFGIWCTALAYLWGKELSKSKLAGLISASIFYISNIVFWESQNAYIDLAVTFFVSLALYYFSKHLEQNGKTKSLLLVAVFLGAAVGAKLLSIYFVAIVVAVNLIVGIFSSKKSIQLLVKESLILGVVPLLLWIPWGLYSFTNTHNPVYPLMEGVFNGNDWFSGSQLSGMTSIEWIKFQTKNLLLFPIKVIKEDFGYSPLLIWGFLASLVVFIKERKSRIAGLLFISFLVLWNYTPARGGRFFLPITIMLAAYSSLLLYRISQKGKFAAFLVLLGVVLNSFLNIYVFHDSFPPDIWVYSKETEQEYLKTKVSQNMWAFYDHSGDVGKLIRDSKVLVYNVHNLFHLDFDFDDLSWTLLRDEFYADESASQQYIRDNYKYLVVKRSSITQFSKEIGLSDSSFVEYEVVYEDPFSEIIIYQVPQ